MNFKTYIDRLATLHEYFFEKKAKIIEQKRFQVLNDSMQMNSVKKTQFAGLYDTLLFT